MQLALIIIPVDQLVRADVPYHHRSSAVFSLGNDALKLAILDRMVLRLHGEAALSQRKRRTFGHRPRFQHAVHFEAKVVMHMAGGMFLHDEPAAVSLLTAWRRGWRRLRRLGEIALLAIGLQRF